MHLFKRSKSTIAKKQQDTRLSQSSSRPPLTNNNRELPIAEVSSDLDNQQYLGRKIIYHHADGSRPSQYVFCFISNVSHFLIYLDLSIPVQQRL